MRSRSALTVCLFLLQCLPTPLSCTAALAADRTGIRRDAETRQKPSLSKKRTANARPDEPTRRCPHAPAGGALAGREAFESLRARARAEGSVSVIVRLCLAFRPEGELSDAAVRLQRARIRRAQTELARALRGFKVSAVRRYEFTPFVSMSVDDRALLRLKKLPVVAEVSEDAPFAPAQE